MSTIDLIESYAAELTAIRHDLHAHPEIGFEEFRTSDIVASQLASWGIEVHRGLGGTGVVGLLKGGMGEGRRIGLRADMDALPMQEAADVPYRSRTDGKFHGCGHDGHTTSLLGTARYLAETRNFSGTAIFIFQPAEEGLGGARAMLKDGLLERFPCDEIYGFHNWPDLDLGQALVIPGPCMAGADFFDITLTGQGSHGAMPHQSRDPITAGGSLIGSLQTIVSRNVDPLDAAVVSITRLEGGSAYNIIPSEVRIAGTVRFFSDAVRATIASEMQRITEGCASTFGVKAKLDLRNVFSVTVNDMQATRAVMAAASEIVGPEYISDVGKPTMGSEDFADILKAVPGAYFLLGHRGSKPLHHPEFVFDDAVIPIGASILARLVEQRTSR